MSGQPLTRWPAVGYEDAVWDVSPVSGMPRREARFIGTTYRASVPPTIADLDPSGALSSETLADAEEARAAVERLDSEVGRKLGYYSSVLLRSEAVSSSRIENITAGARAIAEADVTGNMSGNAGLVAANVASMREALATTGDLDEERILRMHDLLLRDTDPEIAGRFRDDQVWIGSANVPHRADFVPPVAERVCGAMRDLTDFLDRDDVPVVVQAAIAHAQFETIHPFTDGNGRAGRSLLHAHLSEKGVLQHVAVPVSSGLLVRRDEYVTALTAYRRGDPDAIVAETSRAMLLGAAEGRRLIEETEQVRAQWAARLSDVRSDSAAHRLADGLVGQPVVSVTEVRQILGTDHNVHRHIDVLVGKDILTRHTDFRTRNMIWRAQELLDRLDAYAERIGKRKR